jgi:hypothetical protein
MHRTTLPAALLCALLCSPAMAETGVGLQIGTTGYGADLGYQINDRLGARVGYSAFNYSHSVHDTDVDYDGKLKLSSFRALADLELGYGFRVTGGLAFNNNRVDIDGRPSGTSYTLNGTTYQASDVGSLKGRIKLGNGAAPYLGLGYGMIGKKGLGFYADIGAMYMGKPKTTLDVTCGSALSAAQCSQLRTDAEAERQKVEDKASDYKWYPVLSAGISYAF